MTEARMSLSDAIVAGVSARPLLRLGVIRVRAIGPLAMHSIAAGKGGGACQSPGQELMIFCTMCRRVSFYRYPICIVVV